MALEILAMVKQHGGLFLSVDLVPVYTQWLHGKACSVITFRSASFIPFPA